MMTAALFLMMTVQTQGADFETAKEAVKNMGVGWNLGNTLDAHDATRTFATPAEHESYWGQSPTKPEVMRMMKEAGFNAIRVPVTWYQEMDQDGKVNEAWMNRVKEIVDYVTDQGMYCIINVHHDTGADGANSKSWLKADEANYIQNKDKYEGLWRQIAEKFKDYDQKLLFESYNEMLDKLNSWCFASFASSAKYDAAVAQSAYSAINSYAQSFVDVVRATGGNNAQRNLIVNTYGACSGSGSWNSHLKDPLKEMKLPTDAAKNHIAFEVHSYLNIENLANAKKEIDDMLNAIDTHLAAKGAPVIIGEWGTSNVDKGTGKTDYDVRRNDLFDFVRYFVQQAKEKNIATFYWMGLSDGAYRSIPAFHQADLAETMVKAYRGESFVGKYPNANTIDLEYVVRYEKQWAEASLFSGSALLSDYKGIRLELAGENPLGYLKIKVYGDADKKEQYEDLTLGTHATTVTFNASALGTKATRITLQNYNNGAYTTTISKAVLIRHDNSEEEVKPGVFWGCSISSQTKGTSGINTLTADSREDDYYTYTLAGHRVKEPRKGIYIKNGKKYIRK